MSRKSTTKARSSILSSSGKQQSNGEQEKNIWSSMLDSVASGKKLPEKNLIVLGGNPEIQKEFLETLESDAPKRPLERHRKKPPIANRFALGYTYQDVLDTDHEDILARLSLYLLSEASPSFAPLLKPLLTPRTVPETLLVILLDWSEPWLWVRQLRDWIRFLREILLSLDDDTKDVMEDTMKDWQQRRRGGSAYDTSGGSGGEGNVTIPLSQGEWDEALGLPLCVVCHSANKIEMLEKEHSWREEEFDYVLQFLRTILMKRKLPFSCHTIQANCRSTDGASLIYTSTSVPNSLPTLIHSSLGIYSLLKRQSLKHNVIDRDKVLVPPNWDSWGKIRVLREGFDVEGVSSGWSTEIELHEPQANTPLSPRDGAVPVLYAYEDTIPNPKAPDSNTRSPDQTLEIPSVNTQVFLASQLAVLDRLKAEEEKSAQSQSQSQDSDSLTTANPPVSNPKQSTHQSRINDHIGPVQFNMGGIQVDADDMVRRLKEPAVPESAGTPEKAGTATPEREKEGKAQNEALASFFAGLMKRGAGAGSPKQGGT